MLQRQRELTVQALNGVYNADDKEKIKLEINQLADEITAIATKTEYNTINLLARGEYNRVDAGNSYTSLGYATLGTDAVHKNGDFNFTATNPSGSMVKNLIYKPSDPWSSSPEIRIKDASKNIIDTCQLRALIAQETVPNPTDNSWETRYVYNNGTVNVEIVQTVTIKDDPARGGQLYDIQYDIINNSSIEVLIDFSHDIDLYLGNSDEPFIYDRVTGEETNVSVHYEGADIPEEVLLRVDGENDMSVICVLNDGSINPKPHQVIFQRYNASKWEWEHGTNPPPMGDSGYNVIWKNEALTADGGTMSLRTQYGVTSPRYNPIINDSIDSDVISPALIIHTGPNEEQNLTIFLCDARAEALDVHNLKYDTHDEGNESLDKIDKAISTVTFYRTRFGAYQNRLEHTILNLDSMNVNLQMSLSRIQDTDMANESTEYAKNQVIAQAGISILAQANQRPQQILQLLR